jgi:hypothetical protein
MVDFFNTTGAIGGIVTGMIDMTGTYFTAMLLIVILLMVLCLALQMPLEMSVILVLPFMIVCFAFVPSFISVIGVTAIYLGILLSKNFIVK